MLSSTRMPPPPFEGFYSGGIRNPAKVMPQSVASRVAWDDNDIRTRASIISFLPFQTYCDEWSVAGFS